MTGAAESGTAAATPAAPSDRMISSAEVEAEDS